MFRVDRRPLETPTGIERLLDYHVSLSGDGDEMKALKHLGGLLREARNHTKLGAFVLQRRRTGEYIYH